MEPGKGLQGEPQFVFIGGWGQALNQNHEQESSGFGDKQTGPISVRCGVSLPPRLSNESAGNS